MELYFQSDIWNRATLFRSTLESGTLLRSISVFGALEPSIAFNMKSRECLYVIVGLLRTILGYIVQSQQLVEFFSTLASWRRRSALLQGQISLRRIILCLSISAVYIIPDNILQQYRTVLFTLYRRAFCTGTRTFAEKCKRSLRGTK